MLKATRKANAQWLGSGKEGKGTLTTASGVLDKTKYSANSRFGDEKGTNPEELLGAAHAGCFSMKLAFVFQEAGFTPESIDTEAKVIFEDGIKEIVLTTRVKAPGVDKAKFTEMANNAKENCPVSKLFKAKITLDAALV
ncbi:MAG: OsmC family protein [Cyclobacteriaceae bacterium]|nr:OsmC family protein [Cyclobacteriaceae bacterium SS2]